MSLISSKIDTESEPLSISMILSANENFQKQEGVPPRMFKMVIAASHPEFSSMRQQVHFAFLLVFTN